MAMKFFNTEHALVIDFERPDGRWVLLSIDDDWDGVKHMVVGGEGFNGLRERCVEKEPVDEYWSVYGLDAPDPLQKCLLLLPRFALAHDSISRLVFSGFPPLLTEVDVASWGQWPQRLAAMLDVQGEAGAHDEHGKFLENSWSVLDRSEVCPSYARVILSRGYDPQAHDAQFRDVACLLKARLREERDFAMDFDNWWASVEADLRTGAWFFGAFTKAAPTHEARTLLDAPAAAIWSVLSTMQLFDSFGVWAWCRAAAGVQDFELQRRWFAAKAFQYAASSSATVPVTALVALLHGVATSPHATFVVDEGVLVISLQHIAAEDPMCLGSFQLKQGSLQGFAGALRDWLLHPEQRAAGNSSIEVITIGNDGQRVTLALRYSKALPEELFPTVGSTRSPGSARSTLNELTTFCHAAETNTPRTVLTLFFEGR
jgi:hypothetical protein